MAAPPRLRRRRCTAHSRSWCTSPQMLSTLFLPGHAAHIQGVGGPEAYHSIWQVGSAAGCPWRLLQCRSVSMELEAPAGTPKVPD